MFKKIQAQIEERYNVQSEVELGHLIVLNVLLPLVESSENTVISKAYQNSWDSLPPGLIREFCDHHGIVT